jgi:D-serine deaminase-like pyridoxal phosphate-dependent protein
MYLPPIGTQLEELDTPALVVDASVLERNIARMAAWSRRTGCAVRPHAKAHKTPLIARKQLAAGAIGTCCAKLGEAEAMVAGGVSLRGA